MRLLLTGDTAGGVFTFVQELARALQQRGCEVSIATFGPDPLAPPAGVTWFHHKSKLEWEPDPWKSIKAAGNWLARLVDREKPDVLHFNTLCHGDRGWPVPVVTTVHSCVGTWWSAVKNAEPPAMWDRYREVVRRSLEAAALVTFPSCAFSELFRTSWRVDLPENYVVPNGIFTDEFFCKPKEPFAFSAGRFWDEAKNLKALDRVSESAEWPIYLAGEANTITKCLALGQLSPAKMKEWYARASLFISPALYEPFGLGILEAAASGCALLLNDIPSLRENWSDAAMFCQPEEMASALNGLIRSPALLSWLQRQAWKRAQEFSHKNLAARYQKLYEHAGSCACIS